MSLRVDGAGSPRTPGKRLGTTQGTSPLKRPTSQPSMPCPGERRRFGEAHSEPVDGLVCPLNARLSVRFDGKRRQSTADPGSFEVNCLGSTSIFHSIGESGASAHPAE
jgi:hypothetical protein